MASNVSLCYSTHMKPSEKDQELVQVAAALVNPQNVPGGIISEVGCALRTKSGQIHKGVCMHLVCGLGFCGESTAIAAALTHEGATDIEAIVAVNKNGIIPPCGRCRELINDISPNGSKTWVILSAVEKLPLSDHLPRAWDTNDALSQHLEA
jgi:cytidine deaminase